MDGTMPLHLSLIDPGPERQVDLSALPDDEAWTLVHWPGAGFNATLWGREGRELLDTGTCLSPQEAIDELAQLRLARTTIAAAGGAPADPAPPHAGSSPAWTWQEIAVTACTIGLFAYAIWLALS